jgi:hypothetical protein
MMSFDSAFVVLVCTLAGGFDRASLTGSSPVRPQSESNSTSSCSAGSRGRECLLLDTYIHPLHLFLPWGVALTTLVILGMPTVLLRSKAKAEALRTFTGTIFQFFCLLLCSYFASEHPTVCFALTIHSCVFLLLHMDVSRGLVGGGWWWGLRYLSVALILGGELCAGPAVSVIRWPSVGLENHPPCAYLAHLVGCVVPNLVLSFARRLVQCARYLCISED